MKFVLGLLFGAVMSFAYVRYNVELPTVLQIPGLVQNAALAVVTDDDLYDLEQPLNQRQRALEVYFQSQPKHAAGIDYQAGSPFLEALYKRRATRQARLLKAQWSAFDNTMDKPALRETLERAHGTTDRMALKRAMLWKAYQGYPFLKAWFKRSGTTPRPDDLYDHTVDAAKGWPVRSLPETLQTPRSPALSN